MKRLLLPGALVILAAALAIIAIAVASGGSPPRSDTVAANDVVRSLSASWPDIEETIAGAPFPRVTVLDADGNLLGARGTPITSDLDAYRARAATFDLHAPDGLLLGRVRIVDDAWSRAAEHTAATARWACIAVIAMAVVALTLLWWVHRRILGPFGAAQAFATRVAQGDLDTPLRMDRGNILGAYTESFDLMRTELAAAKRREAETRQATKDLVAELSHDIRTPVASIGATAEVLALTEPQASRRVQLEIVVSKSRQIGALIADLFHASEDELAALPLQLTDIPSTDLAAMVRQAESMHRVEVGPIADCLLRTDPLRLQQVLDNVLANADKYADPPLQVSGAIDGDVLQVRVRDHGPSLPASELEAVLGKGVRGTTASGQVGSGLGLYTSAYLMERMGGSLHLERAEPGLVVVIALPLAT